MTKAERFNACIIGDAYGSTFENETKEPKDIFYPFRKPERN